MARPLQMMAAAVGGGRGGGSGDDPTWPDDGDDGPLHDPAPVEDDGLGGTPPASAPGGISQEDYDRLNPKEKQLCWQKMIDCGRVILARGDAEEFAEDAGYYAGIPGPHNGPQDAIRHAMWNARMTQLMDAERAKQWADAHELDYSMNPPSINSSNLETVMDLHNNAIGRSIGASDPADPGQAVIDAYQDGQLQDWVCPAQESPFPEDCS